MNDKYYATATTPKGESKIITNLSDVRTEAWNAAVAHCKKNGLNFGGLFTPKSKQYTGQPTSKTLFKRIAAERSKK